MEQPWPRQRYLEPPFDPAAVVVPPVVSVDIYATIPNIPQIRVGGFGRGALEKPEEKTAPRIAVGGSADNRVVLVRYSGGFDFKTHVGEVLGLHKTRFRGLPFVITQHSCRMKCHCVAHDPLAKSQIVIV